MSQRAADFPDENDHSNAWKRFIAVVITYGICGTMIVLLLILMELVRDPAGTSAPLIGIAALALPALLVLSTIWPNYKLAALGLTSFCATPILMIVSLMVLAAEPDPSCGSCFIKMIQNTATIILIFMLVLSPWSILCTAVARRARHWPKPKPDRSRCRRCGYALFGLPHRRCPECGERQESDQRLN